MKPNNLIPDNLIWKVKTDMKKLVGDEIQLMNGRIYSPKALRKASERLFIDIENQKKIERFQEALEKLKN